MKNIGEKAIWVLLGICIIYLYITGISDKLYNSDRAIEKRITDSFNDAFVVDGKVYGVYGLMALSGHFMSEPDVVAQIDYFPTSKSYSDYVWTTGRVDARSSEIVKDVVNEVFDCESIAIYLRQGNYFMRIPFNTKLDTEIEALKKEKKYVNISGIIEVDKVDEDVESKLKELYSILRENDFYFKVTICGKTEREDKTLSFIARLNYTTEKLNNNRDIDITYFDVKA